MSCIAIIMVIRVGINGFGRIGRIISRACLESSDLQLSAINDPAISIEYICYLIKFDSTHGKFKGDVSHNDNEVIVNGHHIKVYHEKLPSNIPWQIAGAQYVVEASGMFTNYEKAKDHLESKSVKRVIVTAPSVDLPMIVMGVNDDKINKEKKVISCTSSTLYCLAPIVKILEDTYGVEEGFITSIHAMTPSLKPLDGLCLRGRHWRDHRSIHQNIIPATTGACKALGKILPQVKDKLSGLAFRVPIVNVSVLDLTVRLNRPTTLQEITKTVRETSNTPLGNIIRVSTEETVSSDFVGETYSCIFDEDTSIQLKPNFFKIICWYENEYSYACRVIDTIKFCEKQDMGNVTNFTQANLQISEYFRKTHVGEGKADVRFKITTAKVSLSGKPPNRPIIIKKPSATVPSLNLYRDAKRKSELFKIWNDTDEISRTRQNKNPYFQSCLMFPLPPPIVNIERSAKECLENVKREFSKMANITESLLMKTHSNQSSDQSKSTEEVKRFNDVEITGTYPKKTEKVHDKKGVHSCGDTNSLASNDVILIPNNKDEAKSSHSNIVEGNLDVENEFTKLIDAAKCTKSNNDEPKQKVSCTTFSVENFGMTKRDCEFKQQVAKTMNVLIDGLSQSAERRAQHDNTIKAMDNKNTRKELNENHNNSNTSKSIYQNNISEFHVPSTVLDENDTIRNDNCIMNKERHLKVVDHELRKRNIILIDNQTPEGGNLSNQRINERDECTQRIDDSPNTVVMVSQKTSRCESPENTVSTISNYICENKQDIYDKLDSASGSDNSFEISERKSQVIQITDLTNSLEDLARLDKICRIIEISDELSDKLFSALDDDKGNHLKMKKWSFKDLCDRIKLDEFCNKVFGRTNYVT